MKKRKFIQFSDAELLILKNALEKQNEKSLVKEINDEIQIRDHNKKEYEKWSDSHQTIYCC